jgi:tetratricopeptide (TPR) repeat protein
MINEFLEKITFVNNNILKGNLDEALIVLVEALDMYEAHHLSCNIPNVFDHASNVIEGFTRRVMLLKTLKRLIGLAHDADTKSIYTRYLALATALYGKPEKGLKIIETFNEESNIELHIELQNIKGLILTKLDRHEEVLEIFLENYKLIQENDYKAGYRLVHNIGSAYTELYQYDKAIEYFKLGISFDFEMGFEINGLNAMVELADVYINVHKYAVAKRTLKKVMGYEVLTQNPNLYKEYCSAMYRLNKITNKFEEALFYHEILKDLEIQLNMEYYSGLLDHHHRDEDDIVLLDHDIMSDKLRNTNKFLKTTLAKSHEMQQELMAKNQELEATMESLNSTQEKLLTAEKRNVLDSMFINIANHMNTPLGVMNTATSHIKNVNRKTTKKFEMNQLGKQNLIHHLEEVDKTVALYEESMHQVIAFVDTLKLYKTNDEEEIKHIHVKKYLMNLSENYKKYNGIEDIGVICHEDTMLYINTSLFEKCIDLVSKKLLINSERNGFDIEVSIESSMLSIGIGDFKSEKELKKSSTSLVDSYDFYIVQTIVENLLGGRFIKFQDRGRDYFQFIFNLES